MRDDSVSRQNVIDTLLFGKEILSRVLDDMDVVGTDREKYSWGLELIESSIEDIEGLPPAQPEIVRCKDCKYYTSMIPNKNLGICSLASRHLGDDGFCSEGERK